MNVEVRVPNNDLQLGNNQAFSAIIPDEDGEAATRYYFKKDNEGKITLKTRTLTPITLSELLRAD